MKVHIPAAATMEPTDGEKYVPTNGTCRMARCLEENQRASATKRSMGGDLEELHSSLDDGQREGLCMHARIRYCSSIDPRSYANEQIKKGR